MIDASYFIENLKLEEHIEGGYFREVYRNPAGFYDTEKLFGFEGERSLATTIFYLLKSGQKSRFHKLKSDEIWLFHYGSPLIIHKIDENGIYSKSTLGLDLLAGEMPQILISGKTVFAAEPLDLGSYTLVSCMVSPGFDFKDFKMYTTEELIDIFPDHKDVIKRMNG